jgi:acyl-CoA synthetase (AMP-forming)/AMP-acid ligase II
MSRAWWMKPRQRAFEAAETMMTGLSESIRGVLAIDPAAPAIEFEQHWTSWGALDRILRELDGIFATAGLPAGARVGVLMRNHVLTAATLLQLVASDRCVVTLNPSLPDERLAADIAGLKVPVLIGLAKDWARGPLRDAAQRIGCLGIVLSNDSDKPVQLVKGLETVRGADLLREAPGIAIEMLTSGTTGAPKRIPLTASAFTRAINQAAVYDGRGPDDAPQLRRGVLLISGPLTHLSGVFNVVNCVASGRRSCLLEKFSVESWVDAVRRHRLKVAWAPPSGLRMLLDAKVPKDDLASLLTFRTGTAPLDPALADELFTRYGIPVLQNYGATEFAGGVAGWTLGDFKAHHADKRGAVGKLNPGVTARIVDPETGQPLAFGEQGLLELKAPQIGDGTAWIRTTDLALLDADDFLWIKGRYDNAIIRGGFKVQPDDVVKALEAHPAIREAAVVGIPDARLGQTPAAAFILRHGFAAPSDDELRAFLKERLLPYQVPVTFLELHEFPRTPSMKVSQPDLKAMFARIA